MIALAHYFTSRRFINLAPDGMRRLEAEGRIETEAHPLYLPRHTIRALLMLTFVAFAFYLYRESQLLQPPALSILGVVFAYLLGIVARGLLAWWTKGRKTNTIQWWEDVKATVVLLALFYTAGAYLLDRPDLVLHHVRNATLGLVLFYFGSRLAWGNSFAADSQATRKSMRQIRTEIEINAPASRVWTILTDFAHYPEWKPFIRKLEGKPTVGNRLRALIQPPGLKAMTFRPVVLKAEPERELRWLGQLFLPRLFDGEHSFAIEPVGEGKTLFRQSEQFRGILVSLFWRSMADQNKRGFEAMNEALKRLGGSGMNGRHPCSRSQTCCRSSSMRPRNP